ncbi:MAG: protein involved in polysaccharide export with SLBB domain [Sediminicola sp.]|jgi:protein involved in polysaccharide export with SLBB domain|tara:strand:- start:1147 stop:3546 length:2400 start_codon:yes stop_codon:yes gene_type:complete
MNKTLTLFLLIFLLFQTVWTQAQGIIENPDLSTLKIDNLSDFDIETLRSHLKAKNLTIDGVMPLALSKGMKAEEFIKLKSRLGSSNRNENESSEFVSGRKQEVVQNVKIKDYQNLKVFGSELFDNPTLNFEPNLKIASPMNYIMGPGDEIQITVFGVQEYSATIPISVEGKISIQNVGQLSVSGLSFEATSQKIKNAIAKVYTTVASGQSQVEISLSRIRTIKITLIGSKQPGNYSISSLGTVYNALFLGGGPGENETYRNIELLRNNKVIRKIDIYNFLVKGNQEDNVGLKDNDVLRIPAYQHRVALEGQVKRPGLFEMKEGETFEDLLKFASGFNDMAYRASVSVIQKTAKEFKIKDLKPVEFVDYIPKSGDAFKVSKILNRFENRISIEGAVFRPNTYSFSDGMRILDLISKAEGLKEDAYTKRAIIIRVKSDLTTEVVNIDLEKALNGDFNSNVLLKKEDVVTLYSILNFKEDYKITINGEINIPGIYQYYENLTLNDLLVQAGGLSGSASKRVEVARMIKLDSVDKVNLKRVELIKLEISTDNIEQAKNFSLEPFDVVSIRKMPLYEKPEIVTVNGAVNYSGVYALINKKEKIYDIIQRAGGLSSLADPEGVKILRPINREQIEDAQDIDLSLGEKDSIQDGLRNKLTTSLKYATIPVDWKEIQKDENSNTNVTLFPGDMIEVSVFREGVRVTGNVLLTSEIPYEKGKSLRHYVNAVGGVDSKGLLRKAYILYPNGEAATSKSFMFIPFTPKVKPGSQIIVPQKPDRNKLNTLEIISIGSIVTSLALLIITAFN